MSIITIESTINVSTTTSSSPQELEQAYLHATADRMMKPLVDHFTADEYNRLDNFFRNYLLMPADRQARDSSINRLKGMMRFAPIKGLHNALCQSVELCELSKSLDQSMVNILQNKNAHTVDQNKLERALVEESRFQERIRMLVLLANNTIYYQKFVNLPSFITKSLYFALDTINAPALSAHIEALLDLARHVKGADSLIQRLVQNEITYFENLAAA